MIQTRRIALLIALSIVMGLGFMAEQTTPQAPEAQSTEWDGDYMEGWQGYDRLVKEQKYEAAASLVERMLEKAREAKDSTEWTRSLVRTTRLRIALAGHEAALRFLKEQPWPENLTGSSILNLYYAHALTDYARVYSWEINKREKIATEGAADLEAWTREEIHQEAQKALEAVWQVRDRLGKPVDEWKEYLAPNTYPRGVRPTLRDAVSYLSVDMLADTNGWRPDELNEIFRLDLESLLAGGAGDISLVDPARHPMEYVHLRDPRGAGFEPSSNLSRHQWDLGIGWYEEIRDSGTNFFFERLPQGEYTFRYRIRATTAGTFKVAPATVQPMYAPEFAAYSTGATLKVAP